MVKFSPDPGPTPDADLMAAVGRGDVEAFDELYGRYRGWVFRLAWRFTGNEQDALDILQETFVYLLQKSPRLQLWAKLTTFLYPAVKHIALTLRRRRGRTASLDAVLESAKAVESSAGSPATHDLAAALAALPEPHREVLLMRFVDDMSLEEIAQALGIPLGTVKSRLHNAVARLRDHPSARKYFQS